MILLAFFCSCFHFVWENINMRSSLREYGLVCSSVFPVYVPTCVCIVQRWAFLSGWSCVSNISMVVIFSNFWVMFLTLLSLQAGSSDICFLTLWVFRCGVCVFYPFLLLWLFAVSLESSPQRDFDVSWIILHLSLRTPTCVIRSLIVCYVQWCFVIRFIQQCTPI